MRKPIDALRNSRHTNLIIAIIVFGLAIFLPYFFDPLASFMNNAVLALAYVVMALGLNIVVGFAGLLDLGYVAFYAFGSYTVGWLASDFFSQVNGEKGIHVFVSGFPETLPGIHLNFLLLILAAVLVCAVVGILIGLPTLRLRGDYIAIVTLAFGEIIRVFAFFGDDISFGSGYKLTNGRQAISPVDQIDLPGLATFNSAFSLRPYYWFALGMVAFVLFVNFRLRDSRLGRAWVAIREDEVAAASMGVPLVKTKLMAYATGGALGGMAGAFLGAYFNSVNANQFQFGFSIFILAMIILGGLGSIWGVRDRRDHPVLHQHLLHPGRVQQRAVQDRPRLRSHPAVVRDLRLPHRPDHDLAATGPAAGAKAKARARRGHRGRRDGDVRGQGVSDGAGTTVPEPAATEQETDQILSAEDVSKVFGGLVAVSEVNFSIPRKGIVSIIGPNGAGKTTFFNMLTGLYKPTTGKIVFDGKDVTGGRPDKILAMGMSRTFQNIRMFATMSALENVMVGQHARMKAGLLGSIFRPPWVGKEERTVTDKAHELLEYVGLRPAIHDELAINLAYGDQRRVEIARALASEPKLLLLDEPTAGMNPQESANLVDFMRKLREERGHHDPAHRARHEGRHERLRAHHRARSRQQDLRGPAGGRPQGPEGRRGLSRHGRCGHRGRRGELTMPLLEVDDIHTYYGNIEALKGISLTVEEGEIVTLIGSNGAGKSTTLRSISGVTPPRQGTIRFNGEEISGVPPQNIVQRGISQSPEGRHVFPRMTVRENLDMGAYLRRDDYSEDMERVFELFPRLKERERQKGGTMSGGEQQMLAIGRALMAAAEAAAARRALDGHRADPGGPHLRDDPGDQRAGDDDPARRAERDPRPERLVARLRPRHGRGRAVRLVGRATEERRRPEGLPRRMTGQMRNP